MAGSPNVAPETRQKVMLAVEALHFEPNPSARRLACQKTDTIALVFPDISGPFYSTVIRGVEQEAGRYNNNVLIYGTHGKESSGRFLRKLTSKVDGLIIMARSVDDETLWSLHNQGVPSVLLSRPSNAILCDTIVVDNRAGAYEAAAHLIAHGHQRIAIISGPANSPDNMERMQGYQTALQDAKLAQLKELTISGRFQYEGGRIAAIQLLEAASPPTAILAANDEMAVGAIDAAQQKGRLIPQDLAVIGFDDIQVAALVHPTLTTVHQPMQLLGEIAVRLLFDRLQNPDAPFRHERLATSLMIRQSCGCPTWPDKSA